MLSPRTRADWFGVHDAVRDLRAVPGGLLAAAGAPPLHRRPRQARRRRLLPLRRQLQRAAIL